MGRSFHQPGMVNKNVMESDFEPLCDGTTLLKTAVKKLQHFDSNMLFSIKTVHSG